MRDRAAGELGLAAVLWTLAALIATSITLAFVAPTARHLLVIFLRAPGNALVDTFHAAAFYVPLVLCIAAGLLTRRKLDVRLIGLLAASAAPFLGVALVLRLGFTTAPSVATDAMLAWMSRPAALTISITGTLAMVAALVYSWWRINERSRVFGTRVRRVRALIEAPRESFAAREDQNENSRTAPLEAEPAGPRTLVDLPEPTDAELTVTFRDGHFLREQPATDAGETDDSEGDCEPDYEIDEIDNESEVDFDDDADDDFDNEFDEEADASDDAIVEPTTAHVTSRRSRGAYHVPIEGLLEQYADHQYWLIDDSTRQAAETLRVTLEEFNIQAEVTGIRKGPVITMFEILPAPGVKLNKIVNLADNIALRLAASSVRIVAPIPGKHAVGIEIPNKERAIVSFSELLSDERFSASRNEIPIALGKDIPGDAQIIDLTKTPHVLIAGATGSGKSVCVNSIICSILYRRSPAEVKMILIDPKIVELKFYNDTPHLLTPVITDPKRAFQALQYCIYEMERRYTMLDTLQVRDVQSFNRKVKAKKLAIDTIPYIVVVVDEFADLMATSGKELESTLARLAAMSRAVGIHLVLATQRPSTDVITGLIKANIPSRIAFMVASKVDSRIIIDAMGAEKLLGRGDMLFTSAWDPFPVRMQGAYLSEEEVERVVQHVKTLGEPEYIDDEIFVDDEDEDYVQGELEDPLMEKAIEIVVSARKASASYLQRRLKVGYNRAARMVEEMERLGIVGPQQGSKPREVIGT